MWNNITKPEATISPEPSRYKQTNLRSFFNVLHEIVCQSAILATEHDEPCYSQAA